LSWLAVIGVVMTVVTSGLDLEFLPVLRLGEASTWDDIHGALAEAREQAPFAVTDHGLLVALRYAEVDGMLRSRDFVFGDLIAAMGQTDGPLYDWWHSTVSAFNPPDHTRLRRLLAAAFTPRRVEEMRPRIRASVEEALLPSLDSGRVDGIALAHTLPMRIMGGLLGVPRQDIDVFEKWTGELARGFDPSTAADPAAVAMVDSALKNLQDYSVELVRARRANPQDDLISTLVEERDGADRLTDGELVAHIVFMLFAGHDTTKSALQMASMLTARFPEQTALIREQPALVSGAVEEVMRFESPVFMTTRQPTMDLQVGGLALTKGQTVGMCLVSAARDRRGMPDADVFDICRTERRSIGFGAGIHFCLGVNLAKAELEEAVRGLATKTSSVELGAEPKLMPFHLVRHFKELPLNVTPA
jgi:cytochrome P450